MRDDIPDFDRALEIASEIESYANSPDMPYAGAEFAESVSEKARSIADRIEERGEVSEAQWEALHNMLNGIRKWF